MRPLLIMGTEEWNYQLASVEKFSSIMRKKLAGGGTWRFIFWVDFKGQNTQNLYIKIYFELKSKFKKLNLSVLSPGSISLHLSLFLVFY